MLRLFLDGEAPDVSALRPDVSASLAIAVGKALAADRADRWSSAAEMLAALGETSL